MLGEKVLFLVLSLGLAITASLAPILPQYFVANFTEYTAPLTRDPPYVDGVPEAPFYASRGATYYDWTRQAMIEERYDYCVNIFPEGNMYPCTFFNANNISYLIRNNRQVTSDVASDVKALMLQLILQVMLLVMLLVMLFIFIFHTSFHFHSNILKVLSIWLSFCSAAQLVQFPLLAV
jgi:hypothetical protein